MRVRFKRAFAQFVKKASRPLQLQIEIKVLEVCANPWLGKQKLGDLQNIYVYKFRFHAQEYLMAYQFDYAKTEKRLIWIDLHQIGPHENFYRQLKRTL